MERPVPQVGNGVRRKFQVLDRINVAIVDDHEIVRAGLKQALEREADIAVVGEARTGNEAVHLAETLRPHVMLLDVKLEDVEGPEVCRRVLAASPGTAVVMLTSYCQDNIILKSLNAGAKGYLIKDVELAEVKRTRSEEHTSELQSPCNLVCRLLLEKKKKKM